jgi:hypothetical protein
MGRRFRARQESVGGFPDRPAAGTYEPPPRLRRAFLIASYRSGQTTMRAGTATTTTSIESGRPSLE